MGVSVYFENVESIWEVLLIIHSLFFILFYFRPPMNLVVLHPDKYQTNAKKTPSRQVKHRFNWGLLKLCILHAYAQSL